MVDQFVFVRLVKANQLDLSLFQFDYDLTFSVFFMNPDRTIYGRYGTRSSIEDATREMSLAGLTKSMKAALAIHEQYPANRIELEGKQATESKFKSPDDFPSLRGRYKESLDYQGAVTKSCLHCHQIRDAEREVYRDAGNAMPDRLLFPYPSPRVIGLSLDPKEMATIVAVEPGSPAAEGGFQKGDQISHFRGEAIVSNADIQWSLHNAPPSGEVEAMVKRGPELVGLKMELVPGWRRQGDITWRASSWALRRMGTGGLSFNEADARQRSAAGLKPGEMGLIVKHVGQFGLHAAAKRAGFKKGDLVVSFDGNREAMTPSQLLAFSVENTKPGEKVSVVVVRKGKKLNLKIPMQR